MSAEKIPSLSEFESMIFQYGKACRDFATGDVPESEMHEAFAELHKAIVGVAFIAAWHARKNGDSA